MSLKIRNKQIIVQEKLHAAGQPVLKPLKKVAIAVTVENPWVGRYVDDLTPYIETSAELGREMAQMLLSVIAADQIESYGKGGVVGVGGEQEHANALLTTTFANPIRDAIGGADAWISSMTKVAAGPGANIDVPMNHRDDVYVRSHYDGMTVSLPDGPAADEIVLIFCVSSGPRLNARVGGLTHEEVKARRAMA